MKRVLISVTGFPTDIVEPGDEFDIYTGDGATLRWVDGPDEVTLDWKLEFNQWVPDQGHVDPLQARIVGYGDAGSQLARLYDDIEAGLFGDKPKEGKFYKAIKSVKVECQEKYGDIPIDSDGKPYDPWKPWDHDAQLPAWLTREEAEKQFPELLNDPDYKMYIENMVEGDGAPFDANVDPVEPRDNLPEYN